MSDLTQKKCVPCEGEVPALNGSNIQNLLGQVNGWQYHAKHKHITRQFTFKNFADAMAFVNCVAEISEAEGHHPDIAIHYATVDIQIWTHAIGGLSENDFILAAKIDSIAS